MDEVRVRLRGWAKAAAVFLGLMTIGLFPLVMWLLLVRPYVPLSVDTDGLTMRNGQRLPWSDLVDLDRVTVISGPIGSRNISLRFAGRKNVVAFHSILLANYDDVLALLRRRFPPAEPVVGA